MSDVYLPGRKLRSAARRAVVPAGLWGAYMLASYGLVFVSGAVGLGAVLVGGVAPAAYVLLVKRALRRYNSGAAPALKALGQQQPGKAEGTLRVLRERTSWPRALRNLTGYNLALALHRQGKHAEAIDEMADVDRNGGVRNIDGSIASSLALFHALLGNLEASEAWLAEASRRYARGPAAVPYPSLNSEIALALRRGQHDEARRRLDRDWTEIETTSKGETLRPLRVLRAFAVAQAAGLRDAAAVGPYVAALHPARAADFEYLATSWPELRDFLHTALPSS